MTIGIIATIDALPGHEKTVTDALLKMITPTRAEAGCAFYTLFADPALSGRLIMLERWESQAAFDAHMATAHMATLKQALDGRISQLDIRTLEQVSA